VKPRNEPGIYWFDYERWELGRDGVPYARRCADYRACVMREYVLHQRLFYVTKTRDAKGALEAARQWRVQTLRELPKPLQRRVTDLQQRRRRKRYGFAAS